MQNESYDGFTLCNLDNNSFRDAIACTPFTLSMTIIQCFTSVFSCISINGIQFTESQSVSRQSRFYIRSDIAGRSSIILTIRNPDRKNCSQYPTYRHSLDFVFPEFVLSNSCWFCRSRMGGLRSKMGNFASIRYQVKPTDISLSQWLCTQNISDTFSTFIKNRLMT